MEPIEIVKNKGSFFKALSQTDKSQVGVMTLYPDQDSGPVEIHQGDQIIYVIEGKADVEMNHDDFEISAGQAFIIPAGSQHHIYNKTQGTLFFLTIYAPPSY